MKIKLVKLLPIPIALLIISLFWIYQTYSKTGDFFIKDIDLKGGISLTLTFNKTIENGEIEPIIKKKIENFVFSSSKTSEGYTTINILTEKTINASEIVEVLNYNGFYPIEYSIHFVGPELGSAFFSQVITLLTIAYIFLFIINFYIYKKLLIATTIIISSIANIITVFGIMDLFNQKISFAGFSSMLILIAFAIDVNILLVTKVLSSEKEFYEQYKKALITGLTINSSLVVSMLIVLFLSKNSLLTNIAQILVIGFTADIVNTWILNAALIEVVVLGKLNKRH
jgi:preprotein translocase subunit SecF